MRRATQLLGGLTAASWKRTIADGGRMLGGYGLGAAWVVFRRREGARMVAMIRDVERMACVIERFSGAIRRLGQRLDAEFVPR